MSLGLTRLAVCIRPARPGVVAVPIMATIAATNPSAQLTAPVNTRLPQLTGGNTAGSVLRTTPGIWDGHPGPAYTYAWLRDGSLIPREVLPEYVISVADEGHAIQSEITATNSEGTAKAVSRIIDVLVSVPPNPVIKTPPNA